MPKSPIKSRKIEPYFVSQAAIAAEGISKAYADSRDFLNTDPNMSVKSEYDREDYDYYRKNENVPVRHIDIMKTCMKVYDDVGIVRNVIDLMGDFACQGIKLVHPNKKIEKFYQKWFKMVRGVDRSERFLNMLYKLGNVPVRRFDGKITSRTEEEWRKAYGEDVEFPKIDTSRNVIPARYVFYNPMNVDVIGGELAGFIGSPVYGLRITPSLKNMIAKYKGLRNDRGIRDLYSRIPEDILSTINTGGSYMPLDQDKFSVYFYKKDDWSLWSKPMLYSILRNLVRLKKLELCDDSALDGAISNIRLWTVGIYDTARPENSILPTRASIAKIRNILANSVGGGTMDFVWGPELSFKESNSNVHQFLGPEKYQITLTSIYTGLGIPPALTGSSKDSGFTNNYLSIKTLIERLEYGRSVLVDFWNKEIERVQKAMGFRFPAQIVFDQMILSDEAAEKALLVQLLDRNVITDDTIRGKFDIPSEIEQIRLKRQDADKSLPPKASPFHNPQTEHETKKMFIQSGHVAPSQVGLDLPPPKEGETTPNQDAEKTQLKLATKKNVGKLAVKKYKPKGKNGRPKNKKDTKKRKTKRVLPKTKGFVDVTIWANTAYKTVAEMVTTAVLGSLNKSNVRKLTVAETESLEKIKFLVLANLDPFTEISNEKVYNILREGKMDIDIMADYHLFLSNFKQNNKREPNIEETRQLQCSAYANQFTNVEK